MHGQTHVREDIVRVSRHRKETHIQSLNARTQRVITLRVAKNVAIHKHLQREKPRSRVTP